MDDSKKDISQIKKYLQGDLDARAMHQLEREAQDDPFLMDAIEGFEANGADTFNFDELDARLQQRIAPAKVRSITPWRYYAAAAAVLLFFSIGYIFWPKGQEAEKKQVADLIKTPTATEDHTTAAPDTSTPAPTQALAAVPIPSPMPRAKQRVAVAPTPAVNANSEVVVAAEETAPVINDATLASVLKKQQEKSALDSGEIAARNLAYYSSSASTKLPKRDSNALQEITIPGLPKLTDKNANYGSTQQPRTLPGKVKDADYATPPKASSLLVNELGAPISPNLAVAAKKEAQENSLGKFNSPVSAQAGMSDRAKEAQEKNATATLAGYEKLKDDKVTIAHPKMGQDAYDKYLKAKAIAARSGTVRVSFTVDAKGQLGDFKILKSVNEAIDKKAIDLIKNGPAWAGDVSGRTTTVVQKVVFSKE